MAKSIFQLSPLDAETQRQSQGMGVIDLSPPDLPDIDVPPPPAAPAVSAGARSDGRMPAAAKAPPALVTAFESAALKYDIPLNIIMALGEQESRYNPGALGTPTQWGRAKGLMQFLDSTAARLGINPFDPIQSIDAAAMQLRDRLNRGYSMADAVKEHFAGPDRKKWGSKTARYGEEVLARAARLKGELAPRYAGRPPSGGPWYAPGAEKGTGSGEVSADAVSALVGKPSRAKPTSLADTIENPNDLRNIIARRESEAQRKPDEGNLMPGQRPGVGDQFRSDVKRGVANVGNLGVGLAALGADLVGADDTADALLQRYIANEAENADKNPAVIGTYKNVHDLGDAGRYALEAVGENLPMLVPSLLSGGLGAIAARKAAERGVVKFIDAQIAKGVSREVAERQAAQFVTRRATAGAAGGAAASSVGMESGSIYGDTFSETGKKAPGLALAFGVPAGLLDAIEPVYALRRVAGPAVDQLAGGIIRRIGREAGTQFLIEAGTEGLQTLLEQAPKSIETGQPYWTEELLDQVIDAGLKGGIGGGVIGAGSGALSGRARPAPADPAIDAAAISAMSPSQAAGDVDAGAARTAPVPAEPPVSPAPQAAAPAPEPVAPPPPPPSGPLGRALARAPIAAPVSTLVPTPLAEDATPQRRVLEADGVNVPVQLLGETGDALWVRTESGEELQIPRTDIEAGHVRLVDPAAVKPNLTAEAPAPAPAEELSEVVAPAPQPRMQDIQQEAPASSRETGEMFDAETGEVMIAPAKPARPAKVKPSPSTQNTLPAEVESDTAAASMSEADLRARLRYLASQARTNAGWTKPLLAEKKRVEAAIDAINEAREASAGAIKAAEAQAATSPLNDLPEPTEAQKEAGNYSKGHVAIGGLDVSIENPAGTSRRPEWPPLRYTYGYVKRSEGADGDHVDVFLGPKAADPTNPVFIVDQVNKDGSFDEHKVMVGFGDKGAARRGYLANYEKGWTGLGDITEMSFDDFRTWVKDPERTIAPAGTKVAAAKVVEPQAPEAVVEEPSASETPPPTSAPAVTKPATQRRPTDKKNPNPFVRDGERYTVSQDVDYLSAGATYEIESAGKRSAYFRNVERGGGTSLNNYVIERAMRDGVMSIAPEVAAVAEPDADRSVGKVSPAEQGATLDAPPAAIAAPVPPAESAQTTDDVFSSNKLFTADKVEAARARLREKMNRINSGIDPEVLVDGMTIAGAYIEAGVRKFADYAAAMRADFGERITPYLLSFWEGARNYPGLDTAGMSTPEESRVAHAELLKPGLPVEEAVTLGTEVARPKRDKPAAAGSRKLRDWGVDRIDGWMPVEGGENIETGEGLKDGLKDAFLGDAAAYMRSVAAALRPLGFEPHPNAKGEASNPVARRTGGVAVSGDVTLHLRHPASGTNVFAIVGAGSLRGVVPTDGAGVSLMYRVSTKKGDKQATAGTNRWAPVDLSAIDLADTIAWEVERGQPEIVRDEVLPAEEEEAPTATAATPPAKIEDFGEKLLGARKDYAQSLKERMAEAEGIDVSAEPLSVSWPEPNYQKLLEDGVEDYVVASVRALRDAVPAKPQKAWKLKGWAENVRQLRDYANGLLNNTETGAEFRALVKEPGGKRAMEELEGAIDLYLAAGHAQSLKGLSVRFHHYSLYRGERDVSLWAVEKRAKGTGWSNWPQEIATGQTKQEAIDGFLAKLAAGGLAPKDSGRAVRFDIYSKRGVAQRFYIGKKIGTEYVDLQSFDTAAEARTYLRENQDALVAQLAAYRDIPPERRTVNAPRVGVDHRSGGDVTPELFAERFGFRGVQFGNYVEDQRRQEDLNEAYDALLDMAGVLNVPARSLSLGGQLGLAFGARGKGGVGAASAHYEPGNVVINLTKGRGAGSLAHEWWHALDNYFSRMGGNAAGFLTDTGAADENVRPEMVWAFRNVMEAIRKSAILMRSKELDKRRTRAYWATDVEMSARTFESYVIARLADAEHANDYLANVVSPEAFLIPEAYPYPTAEEMPAIRAAFDEFFQAIEARPVGDDIALFSEAAEPIAAGDMFASPDALKATLDKSKFGPAIQRWIDAGRIVLHQSADTLPIGASRASIRAFLDGDPVVTLKGDEFAPDGYPLTSKVTRWYRENGGETVETPGIGEVSIDAVAVKNSVSHGLGRAKAAAFAAVPDVLRRGKIVHSEPLVGASDGGMAYFVAAPIRMGNQDMVEIVMIKSSRNAKRMYVHEVALREVLRQPTFKTSGQAAGADVHSGAGAGALRSILQNIYAAKPEDDTSLASQAQSGVQGLTTPDGRIHLVADQLTEATALPVLLHEMFHAGVEPLLGEAKWKPLIRRLGRLYSNAAGLLVSGERDVSPFWLAALDRVDRARPPAAYTAEEFGAYAIEERAKLPAGIRDVVDRLLGVFKAWMLRRFGAQAGRVTPAQLQSLAIAALRSQPFAVTNEAGEVRYSRRGPTVEEIDAATPGFLASKKADVGRWIHNKITDAMGGRFNILALLPHDVLAAEFALDHNLTAISDYLELKQQMDSTRDTWHGKTAEVAKAWLIFQKTAGNKVNQDMMDLMHEATLAGVDPAKPFVSILTPQDREALAAGPDASGFEEASERAQIDRQRRSDHSDLSKTWDALPKKARELYVRVRDTYREMSDAFEQALLDNLSKALDIRHRQVKDTYDAELIRIADSDLSEEAKQAAFDEADKVYNRESRVQRYAKGARMTRLRAFFETRNISGPYFPLARFGDYFATARDKESGDIVGFSRFETESAQQAFVAEMKKEGYAVEHGVLGAGGGLRDQVDPQFVVDVETILEGADISDAVRDAVWQRWLETLPDMSLRKSRIHRKGTAGFTTDAMRAFANHMFHGSHQLARLQHALDMEDALDQAEKQAERAKDPNRAKMIVNEMRHRHAFTMNPTGAPWSQRMTSLAFIWFLSWRPSAALANLGQTAVLGVPMLAAYEGSYRSMARASFELTKALKDFTEGYGHAQNSSKLSDDEKRAMVAAYETGAIDRTQSHDLAGLSETGIKYRPGPAMAMEVISWSFHHTERLNREITFLAAYRMARRKGERHEQATKTAGQLTRKIHFNYTNTARARFMQGDVAKAVLVFRNFQVNMLARLIRDTHQAFKGRSAAERKQARIQLIGVTGMMMLSAGITGTWGYGITMAIAQAIGALMGSDDDPEEEFKASVRATLGNRLGNAALEGVPGATLGISLSERIGMPDLWFRSPDREIEGRAAWEYYAIQSMGAAVAMGGNWWAGIDQAANEGQIYRGIETAAPNALKDPMRLYRYASEGAVSLKGDIVKDEFSTLELFYQALGFTPASLARQYEENRANKNKEQRITDRRRRILVDFDKAVRAGSSTADVEKRIDQFNEAHPSWAIKPKDVRRSLRSRERRRAEMRNGIYINPKLAGEMRFEAADGGGEEAQE
ncbi:PLxRFG domain-containing protein [Sphingobium yanoikuyae]|uniref:PLxRFG domain-containing protein n=1 Tax=Sphingobium yanoikuyae TaxID=13690 RepID=UPI000A87A03F|nr:PLxRFG domain-containing protein [Sphingobium yanoikuyae]MDV3479887.1 PLxRFG domain-containing protein [Sphingobium yanoikuyae]